MVKIENVSSVSATCVIGVVAIIYLTFIEYIIQYLILTYLLGRSWHTTYLFSLPLNNSRPKVVLTLFQSL